VFAAGDRDAVWCAGGARRDSPKLSSSSVTSSSGRSSISKLYGSADEAAAGAGFGAEEEEARVVVVFVDPLPHANPPPVDPPPRYGAGAGAGDDE
jgi:hypothetical protein